MDVVSQSVNHARLGNIAVVVQLAAPVLHLRGHRVILEHVLIVEQVFPSHLLYTPIVISWLVPVARIFFIGTTLWVLLHYDLKQIGLYGLPAMPCKHTVSLICVSKAFFPMCHRQVFPININCPMIGLDCW